jgi:hypothetical protein
VKPKWNNNINIKRDPKVIWHEIVDWIHLVANKDQRRALMHTKLNLQLSVRMWNFMTEQPLTSVQYDLVTNQGTYMMWTY